LRLNQPQFVIYSPEADCRPKLLNTPQICFFCGISLTNSVSGGCEMLLQLVSGWWCEDDVYCNFIRTIHRFLFFHVSKVCTVSDGFFPQTHGPWGELSKPLDWSQINETVRSPCFFSLSFSLSMWCPPVVSWFIASLTLGIYLPEVLVKLELCSPTEHSQTGAHCTTTNQPGNS
jgi:hypothetical protein